MTRRVGFILDDDAYRVIIENSTERTRGRFVSDVLLQWERRRTDERAGILERIEQKIDRLIDEKTGQG